MCLNVLYTLRLSNTLFENGRLKYFYGLAKTVLFSFSFNFYLYKKTYKMKTYFKLNKSILKKYFL